MSTRAVFTFKDSENIFSVYKHSDGYLTGALDALLKAKKLAWELPRFEASEFATAFIAMNKKRSGEVYLTTGPEDHGDLNYRYVVEYKDDDVFITAYAVWNDGDEELFKGTLHRFNRDAAAIQSGLNN